MFAQDIQVPHSFMMKYTDVQQPQGQSYYVSTSATVTINPPLIDFSNPIVVFILGMMIAFGISYLAYYIKKRGYTADQVMTTFFGILGLSGIGILVSGIIYCIFDGREGVVIAAIGLLFIYAGGTMLSDMKKEKEIKS